MKAALKGMGPFYVRCGGKTLTKNLKAWNMVGHLQLSLLMFVMRTRYNNRVQYDTLAHLQFANIAFIEPSVLSGYSFSTDYNGHDPRGNSVTSREDRERGL